VLHIASAIRHIKNVTHVLRVTHMMAP